MCLAALMAQAQVESMPPIHVDGRWLVDDKGNHVVLHGVMDTPNAWFNGGRWGWSYDDEGLNRCLDYFEKMLTSLEIANCDIFRLHLDPVWTNDKDYLYPVAKGEGQGARGEADISHFNPERLKLYMQRLYVPLAMKALRHGQYVVMRPPGVCPFNLKVGDYYQKYLMEVWDIVSRNDSVLKYPGLISIELANEPINIRGKGQGARTRERPEGSARLFPAHRRCHPSQWLQGHHLGAWHGLPVELCRLCCPSHRRREHRLCRACLSWLVRL